MKGATKKMSLTKTHFQSIASILADVKDEIHPQVYEDLVDGFATYFGTKNENFNKERFETACGVDELGLIDA
jgi:hypothetical protein